MKKSLKTIASLSALALLVASGLVSCKGEEKPDPAGETKIEFQEEEVTVSPEGGEVSVLYTIINPASGAQPVVVADQDWIYDLTVTDKAVNFIADANTDAEREGIVTLNYTKDVSATFKVKQLAPDPVDEKIDMDFTFDYVIDGPDVTMTVNAVPANVYFYFDAIDPVALQDSGITIDETISRLIADEIAEGEKEGQSAEDVIKSICSLACGTKELALEEKKTYIGAAVGVSMDGKLVSDVSTEEFTTEAIPFLALEVLSVGLDNAVLKATPINDNPYGLVMAEYAEYAGMDDDAILEALLNDENVYIDKFVGEWQGTIRSLNSGTEYVVFGFGYEEETVTTDLYMLKFTTETPGDPNEFTFTSEVTAGQKSATVKISGNPDTVLYYFEVATVDKTEEELKADLDAVIQPFLDLGILPDRISYFKEAGFRGTAENTFTGLKSNTEYVVWAVSIDETTGDYVVFSFGERFFTLP